MIQLNGVAFRVAILCTAVLAVARPASATEERQAGLSAQHDEISTSLAVMRSTFFTGDPRADLDGNGIVNFADLALLRRSTVAAREPANQRGGAIISLVTDANSLALGELLVIEIHMDFSAEATIGGGFDVLYDTTMLKFVDWEPQVIGDPQLARFPNVSNFGLNGIAFGSFGSVSGPALVGTLTLMAIEPGAVEVSLADNMIPAGPFFSDVTFMQMSINYIGFSLNIGNAPGPHSLVDPIVATFGRISLDEIGYAAFSVMSTGQQPLQLGTLEFASNDGDAYSVSRDTCSALSLEPGSTCWLQVQFKPTETGPTQGELLILSDAVEEPMASLHFSGTGVPPSTQILHAPDGIGFGRVPAGSMRDKAVHLRNEGGYRLEIGQIAGADTVNAPFEIAADACSDVSLGFLEQCTLTIRFTAIPGQWQDTFDIPSNDPANPTVTVTVSGEGAPSGQVSLSGGLNGTRETIAVTCTNATTGQSVSFAAEASLPWNCVDNGLTYAEGDDVQVFLSGSALSDSAP